MIFKQGKNVLIIGKINKVQAINVVEVKGKPRAVVSFSINCGRDEKGVIWLNAELWGEQAHNPMIKRGAVGMFAGELKSKSYQKKDGTEATKNFVAISFLNITYCPKEEPHEDVEVEPDIPELADETDLPF